MSTSAHPSKQSDVPVGDRLAIRAGTGVALMIAWLVVGPRIPDTSVDATVTWFLATAGIFLVVAVWTLVPWLRAVPGQPRPEPVALPVRESRRSRRVLTPVGH